MDKSNALSTKVILQKKRPNLTLYRINADYLDERLKSKNNHYYVYAYSQRSALEYFRLHMDWIKVNEIYICSDEEKEEAEKENFVYTLILNKVYN